MKKITILTVCSLLLACGENVYNDGDFFYLKNKGAQMPVIVRGNKSSGVFVLFLHGGPGGTALQKIGLPAFNALEKNYATVFYDQRSSGSSQGNSPARYLTLDQFVEDLDQIVELLRAKYNAPKIFLMGHSWGGCLGTAYLTDPARAQKITGWIEVDGAHNNPAGDDASREWVRAYAKKQISTNTDAGIWNYALDWYAANPDFTSNQLEHYAFLEKSHAYIHDPGKELSPKTFPDYTADYVLNSPADVTAQLTNYNYVIKNFIISDIDLTGAMGVITRPSLIVWGSEDGVIPYAMALQAFQALGTDESQKSILTLPGAGHYSFYESPELFADGVSEFIEKYR